MGVEDVDCYGFEDVDEDPHVTCPEKGAVSGEGLDVDEIEFMVLKYFALPFWSHPLSKAFRESIAPGQATRRTRRNNDCLVRQFDNNTTSPTDNPR